MGGSLSPLEGGWGVYTLCMTKLCISCSIEQPIEKFEKNRNSRRSKCNACRYKDKLLANPDRIRFGKYGLTKEAFEAMSIAQNNSCAICKSMPAKGLVIDHDHATGLVRGLLCDWCNTALGLLKDDPLLLQSAIGYLGNAPALEGVTGGEPSPPL